MRANLELAVLCYAMLCYICTVDGHRAIIYFLGEMSNNVSTYLVNQAAACPDCENVEEKKRKEHNMQ